MHIYAYTNMYDILPIHMHTYIYIYTETHTHTYIHTYIYICIYRGSVPDSPPYRVGARAVCGSGH